jgi:hypothetical protein
MEYVLITERPDVTEIKGIDARTARSMMSQFGYHIETRGQYRDRHVLLSCGNMEKKHIRVRDPDLADQRYNE